MLCFDEILLSLNLLFLIHLSIMGVADRGNAGGGEVACGGDAGEGFAVVGRVLSTSLPTTSGRCQEV